MWFVELIGKIIWPVLIGATIYYFRNEIKFKLSSISQIKFGDLVDVAFTQIQELADNTDTDTSYSNEMNPPSIEIVESKFYWRDLYTIVKEQPKFATNLAWSLLQRDITELYETHHPGGDQNQKLSIDDKLKSLISKIDKNKYYKLLNAYNEFKRAQELSDNVNISLNSAETFIKGIHKISIILKSALQN